MLADDGIGVRIIRKADGGRRSQTIWEISVYMSTTIRPNPSGDWPEVDPAAYIDPTAQVIGRVRIGPRVFIGPGAVIRADEAGKDGEVKPIVLEAECNVQDGAIVHALGGTQVTIGRRTSLSHGSIVHGPCRLGERCFVGFGAVVFMATVGSGVCISARAVVQDVDIPDNMFVPSSMAPSQERIAQLRTTTPHERGFMERVVDANLKLVEGYHGLAQAEEHVGGFDADFSGSAGQG
ncbi:MAG: carbonate dehydratase [Phycisphaerae bacterium]|nr:carbonate dehydratase [Phycisphaerae bacterium]